MCSLCALSQCQRITIGATLTKEKEAWRVAMQDYTYVNVVDELVDLAPTSVTLNDKPIVTVFRLRKENYNDYACR